MCKQGSLGAARARSNSWKGCLLTKHTFISSWQTLLWETLTCHSSHVANRKWVDFLHLKKLISCGGGEEGWSLYFIILHISDGYFMSRWKTSSTSLHPALHTSLDARNSSIIIPKWNSQILIVILTQFIYLLRFSEGKAERINRHPIFSTVSCCLPSLVMRAHFTKLGRQQLIEEKMVVY